MNDISLVSKLFVTLKSSFNCQKCKKEFDFSINDSVYIRLDKKSFVYECPHCGAVYAVDLNVNLLEDNNESTL